HQARVLKLSLSTLANKRFFDSIVDYGLVESHWAISFYEGLRMLYQSQYAKALDMLSNNPPDPEDQSHEAEMRRLARSVAQAYAGHDPGDQLWKTSQFVMADRNTYLATLMIRVHIAYVAKNEKEKEKLTNVIIRSFEDSD